MAETTTNTRKSVEVSAVESIIRELRTWPEDDTLYQHRRTRLDAADKLADLLKEASNEH